MGQPSRRTARGTAAGRGRSHGHRAKELEAQGKTLGEPSTDTQGDAGETDAQKPGEGANDGATAEKEDKNESK